MIVTLIAELDTYVKELCVVAEMPTRPQLNGTDVSGDSREVDPRERK